MDPMAARVQQSTVVLLSVQLDESFRQGAQSFTTDAPVVYPSGFASVEAVGAAQNQFVAVGVNTGFGKCCAGRMSGAYLKNGGHLAPFRASAHHVGPTAPAKCEPQRIEQNRFARPGFAGQHIQPRTEVHRQPLDDGNVANVEAAQHGRFSR